MKFFKKNKKNKFINPNEIKFNDKNLKFFYEKDLLQKDQLLKKITLDDEVEQKVYKKAYEKRQFEFLNQEAYRENDNIVFFMNFFFSSEDIEIEYSSNVGKNWVTIFKANNNTKTGMKKFLIFDNKAKKSIILRVKNNTANYLTKHFYLPIVVEKEQHGNVNNNFELLKINININ